MNTTPDTIRVLYVDDEPDFADTAATFIERENERFAVETVTSADQGLDFLRDKEFGCIISDYDMPGQNGIEFLEIIREDYPDLPFILYTGKGSEEIASDAISAGATDYLQKGVGTDQYTVLANRIQNAVDRYHSQRRADEHKRITEVIRNLNRALVYATSVDEIEHDVCTILADAEPYVTACVAGVNTDTMQIEPRTWAGDAAGYFEGLDMSVDESSPGHHAPGGRAFHELDIAISQNIPEDPQYEQWREQATERGFRSLAVVPLEYDDELYGLLAVFADRRHAFDESEQELFTELGDDIAHAMHAQEIQNQLRENERRFKSLFNDPNLLVGLLDSDGTLLNANSKAMEYVDAEREDLINEPFWTTPWWSAEIQPDIREKVEQAATGEYVEYEADLTRPDGDQYSVTGVIRPVMTETGDVVSLIVSARDVTDRVSHERILDAILEYTTVPMFLKHRNGEYILANHGFKDLFGLSDTEVQGHTDADLFHPEMANEVQNNDNSVLETGEPVETEERIIVNGEERTYLSSKTPVYDIGTDSDPDDPVAIFGVASDITVRREREQEITRLNQLYQTVLSNIRETVVVTDDEGQFTYICPNIQFIFGYDASEVDELETVEALFNERLIGPDELETAGEITNRETTITDKSGDSRTVLVTVREVDIEEGARLYSIRDITERKERQQALQEERQRFELFLDAVEEYAIFMLGPEGYVTSWNQGAEHIKGYEASEILGKHVSTLYPEERVDAGYPGELLEKALREGQITDNGWRVRKDGSQFWADITITAIFDGNDQHRGFVKVTKDITDRKRRERRLQRQLERFEHFGSILSHDLRTPLLTVEGQIELTRETEEMGHLDQAKAAVERLDMLIDDLATVMREGGLVDDLTALDIEECVRDVWHALPTEDATLQIRETTRVRGDETAVTRLLENLLKNALDHGGDTITVGVLSDGFYLEDNGPGIPEDTRMEIFEVGYSTKRSDGEAGFGLASARQIALAHGWEITALEGPNGGARFEITDVEFAE